VDPIYIFHGMIWCYLSMITFMHNHLRPYKIVIKPTSLHYEGIVIDQPLNLKNMMKILQLD
jgi:hypothetical protein